MSVALFVVGQPPPAIAARLGGFPEMFARIESLGRRGFETIDGTANTTLDPRNYSGLIVSGSAASVLDDEPWMECAQQTIRAFDDAGTPVLGVCFGHQLIAKAYGGEVRAAAVGLQSSSWQHRQTESGRRDPLFRDIPESFIANLSHRDEVAVPEALSVLATGPHAIAAIAAGDHVRGVQFHPEFRRDEALAYVDHRQGELGARAEVLRKNAADTVDAARTVTNFLAEFVDRA